MNLFGIVRLFSNFFPLKLPQLSSMLCGRVVVEKTQRVPHFNFCQHRETFFSVCSRRSVLLSNLFVILQETDVLKSQKNFPFQVFRHYKTVSKFYLFVFQSKTFKCLHRIQFIFGTNRISKKLKGPASTVFFALLGYSACHDPLPVVISPAVLGYPGTEEDEATAFASITKLV